MKNRSGKIFNIQHFCLNDGGGIRTVVFFKGCPLNCIWCHNPESKKCESELLFYSDKCMKCKKCVDTLLISPQTTAWSLYNSRDTEPQNELNYEFLRTVKKLEKKHIEFHLGDETIMRRYARVENGKFIIGEQSYGVVIKENCRILMPYTEKLLKEFELTCGKILTTDEIKANNITDCEELTYTSRIIDGKKLHFFVNTSENEFSAHINSRGLAIDIFTGETTPFSGSHSFEPWGSLMVLEDESVEVCEKEEKENYITIKGDFEVDGPVENCLTLDKCDFYFDGELQEKNGYVLNICERACKLGRKVKIHQDYFVNINHIPEELFLVCETPDNFIIKINGKEIEKNEKGYFRDKAFRKINIEKYLKKGENIISFDCDFLQSDKFYEDFKNVHKFEAVKNKLVYDMEIEAIYLVGDFLVKTDGKWEELEREALRYSGGFVIDKPVDKISLSEELTKQGFPFFCGELRLKGSFESEFDNPIVKVNLNGVNAVKLETDEKAYMRLVDNKTKLSAKKGKYDITLTLFNSLRNMLGPHHDKNGELHIVGPSDFYKESGVCRIDENENWNESYCFVKTGVFPNK